MSKVKKKREWKVNSEEQYRKEEGREGVAEEEEKTKKMMSAGRTKNRRKRTRKIAAEMQMIGLQANAIDRKGIF